MQDSCDYELGDADFITLPMTCNLSFAEHLPIRPSESGLSGYRIRDTPIDEDDSDEYVLIIIQFEL